MIRWQRIQKEASKIAGRGITIHGTTALPEDIRAFVKDDAKQVEIVLNMKFNKTEKDVVLSLAHELAHVTLGDEGHGDTHTDEAKRIEKSLNSALERSKARGTKVSKPSRKSDRT